MRLAKKVIMSVIFSTILFSAFFFCSFAVEDGNAYLPAFSKKDIDLIKKTKEKPLRIGIIPDSYPMSVCRPESEKFEGITIDLINLISQKTGIGVEFVRIPVETMTPTEFLKSGKADLVAGTIRTSNALKDKSIVMSDRLFDATPAIVGKKGVDGKELSEKGVKIAIVKSNQVGKGYLEKKYSNVKLLTFPNSGACIDSVNDGTSDYAFINKYVAGYILQKPYYSHMTVVDSNIMKLESNITGLKGKEDIIALINKGMASISEKEHNFILMNFTIASPHSVKISEIIYAYRFTIVILVFLTVMLVMLFLRMMSMQSTKNALYEDSLTGLLSQFGFSLEAEKMIRSNKVNTYFIVNFDMVRFDSFNGSYGRDKGDELLCEIARSLEKGFRKGELGARIYADQFVLLLYGEDIDGIIARLKEITNEVVFFIPGVNIILNFGIYQIVDETMSVSHMIDLAIVAKRSIKGNVEECYGVYDSHFRDKSIEDANIVSSMGSALNNHEFYVVYQPKYNTETEKIVGCEALIRWRKPDGTVLMPGRFIELFEKNGQIIKLDFYTMERVCMLQRKLLDAGIEPVIISVNFSRIHIYSPNFISDLNRMIMKYNVPPSLIEIELTESSMIGDKSHITTIIKSLQKYGFAVAMDDFGSGYSSLNSLKELPIDVLKLDRRFVAFEEDKDRGQKIIKTLLNLTKELSIRSVAEGVETKEQFEFLKSCGSCDMIQGYYFSKPVEEEEYIKALREINLNKKH